MTVHFTDEMKRFIPISRENDVNKLIEMMDNEDELPIEEYAAMAARFLGGTNSVEILKANAEIAKNCRVNDQFFEGSGDLDIWINFVAVLSGGYDGIIIAGACLSDIWSITGHDDVDFPLRKHMFVRKFVEV